ncbi:siderophore-interacting protein [Allorhizocola rhizosphaerae]|uniref:siderophore-interacting protein n=1 Tax=Allorhizocola rhizosphaerae TaxID=1872709 RepID=UPI000E3C356C|nr:siderophore-interacting protein [Allorhizocola rhizosphaerae]
MIAPWRLFAVEVTRLRRLSPTFLRVTFGGDDLETFADNGFDQRIKVVLPLPGVGVAHLPTGEDWHAQWRALPDERRNPIRTYTVRSVRPSEVDVDFVLHAGGNGPAARWAESAQISDKLGLIGPDSRFDGPHGGLEFRPPESVKTVLLAGDETAVPAISSILERMPSGMDGVVVIEVPHEDDFLPLHTPPSVRLRWHARGHERPGTRLVPAVVDAAEALLPQHDPASLEEADPLPWEVPDEIAGPAYVWLAGEAGIVKTLRRHLIGERGLDRRGVALMGYWRLGHAEPMD